MKKYGLLKFSILILIAVLSIAFSFPGNDGKGDPLKPSLIAGDSYRMFINNIDMPMSRTGIMGDVVINSAIGGGKVDRQIFLFSGGFFMSGLSNGTLWANGQMTASRICDYLPGNYNTGSTDPNAQIYVVSSHDPDFDIGVLDNNKKSWAQWQNAVALGADYYDGNHDGAYYPIDLNQNGKWDPDEDRPDLLGDETAWCVYSDLQSSNLRTYTDVPPQGIEIRQSVWGYNTKSAGANFLFIRYKITYTAKQTVSSGTPPNLLDSVYFGIATDPDIGDQGSNDLDACDTTINSGYTYHSKNYPDSKFGSTHPCFLVDFLQGPRSYIPGVTFTDNNGNGIYDEGIDTPRDTAADLRGKYLGIVKYPGARNLGMSSYFQYYGGIDPATKYQARDYNLGKNNIGQLINPCTWTQGYIIGSINCANINPLFMYSGDPVANSGSGLGWINSIPKDQRMIINTGPFQLIKNDPVTIVVAYVIGRGTDPLNSITVAKANDAAAKKLFNNNFILLSVNDKVENINSFELLQNYPNPFNPATTIKYILPADCNVHVTIYNSLGQLIKEISSGVKNSGTHEVNFNSSALSSGVYFYTILANSLDGLHSFKAVKKMLLIK